MVLLESKNPVVRALRFKSNGARRFFTGAEAAAAAVAAAAASDASVNEGNLVKTLGIVWKSHRTYQVVAKLLHQC